MVGLELCIRYLPYVSNKVSLRYYNTTRAIYSLVPMLLLG